MSRAPNSPAVQHAKGYRATRAKESIAVEGRPTCPRHLTPSERKLFRFVCRELTTRRALTKGDRDLIVLYCETVTRRDKAMVDVHDRGEIIVSTYEKNGVELKREVKNPWYLVATEAERTLVALMDRLGITPRSREMVKAVSEKEEEPEDALDKLMGKPRRLVFNVPGAELPS
jgi:P27 family predicted phage terminase small subunit